MDQHFLEEAARSVLSTAILGGEWLADLEPIMTEMNALGGGPARPVPPDLFGVPTSGLRDAFLAFKRRRRRSLRPMSFLWNQAKDLWPIT